MPELDRDAEGRHRKHAAPLHPRSRRGPGYLTSASDAERRGAAAAPLILAIDTAGAACSVALARGDRLIAAERRPMRHGHNEALMPMVAAVMGRHPPTDLDVVAVSVGPGGFTGIRVGLAAAQGIALATGAETIGVTAFAAVAAAQRRNDDPRPLLVAIDSRRNEFYVQLLEASGEATAPSVPVLPEALAAYVAGLIGDRPLRVAGDAAEPAAIALAARMSLELVPESAPGAQGVLAAARTAWSAGQRPEPLMPLYLRPPAVSFPRPRPAGRTRRA